MAPSITNNLADISKLRTKMITIHKKSSQIFLKTMFLEFDEDEDNLINKYDVQKYLKITSEKAEELFS